MSKTADMESGFYRHLHCDVWAGPFASREHAWANAYANDELDTRKSDSRTQRIISKDGQYHQIMHSRYMLEDIAADDAEGLPLRYHTTEPPTPVYSELLGADGLLTL
jgi:hypothetical protein